MQVKPVAEGLDILEVKVETLGVTSTPVTLADVGLGYNQILPELAGHDLGLRVPLTEILLWQLLRNSD